MSQLAIGALKPSSTNVTIRTPIVVAGYSQQPATYTMLSDIFDTFRLLADSMDFMDEYGHGWKILEQLGENVDNIRGDDGAKTALLVWMCRLSSSEMKLSGTDRHYANLLSWTLLSKGLAEATQLLLRLGGPQSIDTPVYDTGGYNVLHYRVAFAEKKDLVSAVLAQGPDIHRLGFQHDYSPEDESPFSLAMYSSWAFADWLDGLLTIQVDFEEFVTEEIERNSTIHRGWEKETLLSYVHTPIGPTSIMEDIDHAAIALKSLRILDCNLTGDIYLRGSSEV